jgi:hypothetical protein
VIPHCKLIDVLLRPELAPLTLDGRKKNTRRIVNPQPPEGWLPEFVGRYCPAIEGRDGMMTDGPEIFGVYDENWGAACPYGGPGDRIRFLTTWSADPKYNKAKPLEIPKLARIWSAFDPEFWSDKFICEHRFRPGRFMPLWMRERLPVFEIIEVRVERAQEISEADIHAEGIQYPVSDDQHPMIRLTGPCPPVLYHRKINVPAGETLTHFELLQCHFASLWDQVNGKGSWARNDWCWAISFRLESP